MAVALRVCLQRPVVAAVPVGVEDQTAALAQMLLPVEVHTAEAADLMPAERAAAQTIVLQGLSMRDRVVVVREHLVNLQAAEIVFPVHLAAGLAAALF